ncbi:MAG: hypothetical protein DWQ05_02725 [Calditrichaeota bacterium]|nr:MAG: hypothetical protein DWQ05_02725 [Calditrichota bacterium]
MNYKNNFRRLVLLLFLGILTQSILRAADPLTVIRRPIINLPAIVQQSQTFEIICEAPQSTFGWTAVLLAPGDLQNLSIDSSTFDASNGRWTLDATVPGAVNVALYDLIIAASGGIADTSTNAVKVIGSPKNSYTIIHISDTHFDRRANIDYNTVPEFLKIAEEINLINPEFVLHSGDLVDEATLERYYQVAQEALNILEVPIWVAPGGSDIQIFQSNSQDKQYWESYFGDIMDFRFNYGNHIFSGLQEWEFPTESFTQQQFDWLAAEFSPGDAMRVLFYHYDVQNQIDAAFVDANNIDLLLYGHLNKNRDEVIGSATRNIGTAATMHGGYGQYTYNGEYRILQIENDQLIDTEVVQYNNLNVTYSPVNNGTNPENFAEIENNLNRNFSGATLRFYVPTSFAPYTVSNGTLSAERATGTGISVLEVKTDLIANSSKTVHIEPVSSLANHPPRITTTSPEKVFSLTVGQSQEFSTTATDADNDQLSYSWKLNAASQSETGNAFTFLANSTHIGLNSLELTVSDGNFADIYSWTVTVVELSSDYAIIAHPFNLVGPDENAKTTWDEVISLDCYFRFGTQPGNYNIGAVAEDGISKSASFIPSQVGLANPGIYYGIITNSSDATISAEEYKSVEFPVIIESQNTAEVLGPKGTITDQTPILQWQAVDGVPYFHVLVSDNPITITEDANGETIVQGANIIWQAITSNTSIRYGDFDPADYFNDTNGTAPPLMSGLTYNFMVLNNYGNHPAFTSAVQPSVNEFVVDVQSSLTPPVLSSPMDNALISGAEITFQWDEVVGAINYKISIFEEREESGSTVSFLVWETTTTNTLVDFPAGDFLINSDYTWKVLAWDETGGGVQSGNFHFNYATSVGTMDVTTRSENGNILPRVELRFTAIAGSSDLIPLLTDDGGKGSKVLREGVYNVTASKDGYEKATVQVDLKEDIDLESAVGNQAVTIYLAESPGSISGRVFDNNTNSGISTATIVATHTTNGTRKEVVTDIEGNFIVGVSSGSWDIYARKTGYTDSNIATVNIAAGNAINLGQNAFGLTFKSGTLSGVVRNTNYSGVLGAVVRAYNNTDTSTTTTAVNGSYSFTLTAKTWTIVAEKTGYVSPQPVSRSVPNGGVATADFSLIPRANIIVGYVTDGSRALNSATVTATPEAGAPVNAKTNNLGQFSLSLGSGTFTLHATKTGYSSGSDTQVSVTVGETVSGVNFELSPNPSSISGKVTSDGTNSVAGATVTNGTVSAITSSSGNFSLSLPEGEHSIYATKSGYATSATQILTLSPGQNLANLDFRITPNAATVTGTVTGSGLALYQATVRASGETGQFQTTADEQGNYSLSLQPGSYSILATKPGYIVPAAINVTANPGQSVANIDFSLILNKGTIKGVAQSASGELLRNVKIMATESGKSENSASTTTTISGEYTLKITAGISWAVSATKVGYASDAAEAAILATGSTRIENFTLTALPSSVAGTVRDGSGNGIENVIVKSALDSIATNHLGNYMLHLASGTHALSAEKSGYTKKSASIVLTPGQNLTGVNYTLDGLFASFTGTIFSGQAFLEGAVVNLSSPQENASASSNSQGKFTFSQLIPGTYSLAISRTGYQTLDSTIVLAENENSSANLNLKIITGEINGIVQSSSRVLSGATVQASGNGNKFSAISNQNGEYTLTGLPKTDYKLTAALSGYSSPPAVENISPDSTGVDFLLTANKAQLTGIVKTDEEPIEAADVVLQGENGNTGQGKTGVDGNFSIENLAADTYSITTLKDGFVMAESEMQVSLDPGAQDSLVVLMDEISLVILGQVKAKGTPRGNTPLQLRNGSFVVNKSSDGNGSFSFGGLRPNSTYTVATNIFKEGITEADSTIFLAQDNVSGIVLNVSVAAGEIYGTVGINSASVTAKFSDGTTYSTVSNSEGKYSVKQLPQGAYTVSVSKSGFESSPNSRSVMVPETGAVEANFTMTAYAGGIAGSVINGENKNMQGVQITAVAEGITPFATSTNENGGFEFSLLPAGKSYTVTPNLSGFSANPAQKTVQVQNNQVQSVDFVLIKNEAQISGEVTSKSSGEKLANVRVVLQDTSTSQGWSGTTNELGKFLFENLSPAFYRLALSKGGYTAVESETLIDLTASGAKEISLQMESQSARLHGVVNYRGQGAEGTKVIASGSSEFSTVVNSQGSFNFQEIPAGVYSIYAVKTGFPSISLPDIAVAKGSDNFLPLDFPGARIQVAISDGKNVVNNVRVSISTPTSQAVLITDAGVELFRGEILDKSSGTIVSVSDNSGMITTDSLRLAGTYQLVVEKNKYLIPKSEFLNYRVGIDELKKINIPLVFQHTAVSEANAKDSVLIKLDFTGSLPNNSVSQANLWVKRIGADSFSATPMFYVVDQFQAMIAPHSQSGSASYFITAHYAMGDSSWIYESPVKTINLTARDVLYTLHISPGRGIIQKGARTKLTGNPVDDTGTTLEALVLASGSFVWELVSANSTAILEQDSINPLQAYLWPQIEGEIRVRATSTLDGITRSKEYKFTSRTMELGDISIQAPTTASNTEPIRVNFIATSTDSVAMRLDSEWRVFPATAGTISESGLFTPSPQFMGDATLTLIDLTSSKEQTAVVNLYTAIDSTTEGVFSDGTGFELKIRKNAVARKRQISLYKPNLPNVKKFTKSYQVKSEVYQLLPAGLEFQTFPEVVLPVEANTANDEAHIGWWEQTQLQWQPLHTEISDSSLSAFVQSSAQFAILQENEPLGIHGLSFLPRVFSPKRGVMRIGYALSGKNGQAFVTIRIYNLSGDLVRTLLERERQYPGVHTESTTAWDGRTDSNKMARNGRYLIEIIAEDTKNTKRKLDTIVLVK